MTNVMFRKFPENDVVALFPDFHESKGMILSYQHIGQHSEACSSLIGGLPAATEEEYLPLLNELSRIGYQNIMVKL